MATCTDEEIAQLRAWIRELQKILFSGAGEVQHGDKRVRYNTPDEIREALRDAHAQLRECLGSRATRVVKVYAGRGV